MILDLPVLIEGGGDLPPPPFLCRLFFLHLGVSVVVAAKLSIPFGKSIS
jgi:hypothetical protein